jgi:hypothetical protein
VNEYLQANVKPRYYDHTVFKQHSADLSRLDHSEQVLIIWSYLHQIPRLRRHFRGRFATLKSMSTEAILAKLLREHFCLVPSIQSRIDQFAVRYWRKTMIGLHIRYTDKCFLHTPLEKYHAAVRKVLKAAPTARIFLATDNKDVQRTFKDRYNDIVVTEKEFPDGNVPLHTDMACSDRGARGAEALVDMYLLARCQYLIYSSRGTFSYVSRLIGDFAPGTAVDVERFNLRVRLHHLLRAMVS